MKGTFKRLLAGCLCAVLCLSVYPLQTPAEAVAGDINNDGVVDILDVLYVYDYVSGKTTLTKAQKQVSDIKKDGTVDLQDVLLIFNTVLQIESEQPAEDATPAHTKVRKGITNESVYMKNIKIINQTTGKTFTATTKSKLQLAVAEIVKYEMGMASFGEKSTEAWKAMAVAAYTELAHYCYSDSKTSYPYSIWMDEDIDIKNNATDKKIHKAVGEVLGIKIAYNDKSLSAFDQLCEVFYGASSAGTTCSTLNAWGFTDLEYIPVVESKYDNDEWIKASSNGVASFSHTFTIPIKELVECIAKEKKVKTKKVGYDTKSGRFSLYATAKDGPYWRTTNFYYTDSKNKKHYITGTDLYFAINNHHPTIHCHSHAITVTGEKNGKLIIKTKGDGLGLGMSQYGAAGYANEDGWIYDQILAHYYGITDKTAWGLVGPKW